MHHLSVLCRQLDLQTIATVLSSLFTGVTALAALIATWISGVATKQANNAANESRFFSLLSDLGFVIPQHLPDIEAERDFAIENDFLTTDKSVLDDNASFLEWLAGKLPDMPVSDHFRRVNLFAALGQIYKQANRKQQAIFRHALHSRIGDEAVRFLILQAVAEKDEETLRIFGSFPLGFENLHRMPSVMGELARRFAAPFANEIITNAKSIKK